MSYLNAITPKFQTFNKKSFIKAVDFLYNSLEMETLPAFGTYLTSNVKAIEKSKFLKTAFKLMNISGSNVKALEKLQEFFIELANTQKQIRKEVNTVSDVLTDKVVSVKEATLVRIVEDFNFLNLYVLDFLYMPLIEDGDTTYPKFKINGIREELPTFVQLYKYYNKKTDEILKELTQLPDINVTKVESAGSAGFLDTVINNFKALKLFGTSAKGFIGNPIYQIRMWLVDREIAKYELLKEKRKELELKILELRYQEQGTNDPSLKKQIEYYEDKLSGIEYEINKIEK